MLSHSSLAEEPVGKEREASESKTMAKLALYVDASLPYVVMILIQLFLALTLTLLQSLLTDVGVSSVVIVVYEQLISTAFLSTIALVFEWGKRPAFSFDVLSWAFLTALLQIPVAEVMLTASLRYITAAFQSVGLNLIPVLVFVLAVVSGREGFGFRSLGGQAKLVGVVASTAGAIVVVVCSDPGVPDSGSATAGVRAVVVGCTLVGLAVLADATSMVLVERLAMKYPADLTLSATMTVFGTLQTVILAAFIERDPSSWRIRWNNRLQLLAIFLGGIVATGLVYVGRNLCVHKKGPVFAAAFSPLLVVFSFLLQVLVLRNAAQISSIFGAVLVIGGLYFFLWAKSREYKTKEVRRNSLNEEPLLVDSILDNLYYSEA
ncbi:WAT1-related protein-like [Iris pallida]|uniref:WAT1-related protein n=1 Tax=Iris pallida TaxID=29817 RepID=A0AAX6DVN1_IRIPA|nr:WAT1-related protein-like [Iris pallida]